MVGLPNGEKILMICLFIFTQLTNVTDGQTDRHRMTAKASLDASIARQKWNTNRTHTMCDLDVSPPNHKVDRFYRATAH